MLYIHQYRCISPQQTFPETDLSVVLAPVDGQMKAVEPAYAGVPATALRRMGKAGRMAAGAAMPVFKELPAPDGIIIGTANGGMEESIRFLKQIVEYNEDMLAPGSFVQSTANAIASQLAMSTTNHGYNITHVHRGLAFENALIDAAMRVDEYPSHQYILGGVDEIASFNYIIEKREGWYRQGTATEDLYNTDAPGSIAGESAAMFLVNASGEGATAKLNRIRIFESDDMKATAEALREFLDTAGIVPDLMLSGENGDNRLTDLYTSWENILPPDTAIARYKHLCGEHPTASGFALWLACHLFSGAPLETHMLKREGERKSLQHIVICNAYQGTQHSFILLSRVK